MDKSWRSGETRRVRLDLEEGDLIFGDLWERWGGRGARTVGRRRRRDEWWKDIGEEVGLTDDQRSLPSRSRLDPDPVPAAATAPALPSPPRPTATTSRDHNAENKIADINNNVAIQQLLSAPSSPSHPMASLLPLLYCPLCPPHSALTAPVTLSCGHTVCARHVSVPAHLPSSSHVPVLLRLTPCPLGCTVSPTARAHLNIPSSSRVTFYPAVGPPPDHDAFTTTSNSRTDVTVNKLALIIHRYVQQQQAQSTQRLPAVDTGSGSDSQTDEEILDTRDPSPTQAFTAGSSANTCEPSSIPRQVSSDGSQQGPARVNARKRRRKRLPPPRRLDAPAQSGDQFEKELLAELTCEICLTLFYQPITSPCQHVSISIPLSSQSLSTLCQTFCSKCLHRSLDHNRQCPLCRQDLPEVSYFQEHPLNKTVMSISMSCHSDPFSDVTILSVTLVLEAFPEAYAERARAIEQEERHSRLDTPIFVCQLSFPGLPTVLHFFEPRYNYSRLRKNRLTPAVDIA